MTGEKEAKGGNEKTNDFIVASNEKNCDTSSDEEMEIESELDSGAISDVENEYEREQGTGFSRIGFSNVIRMKKISCDILT